MCRLIVHFRSNSNTVNISHQCTVSKPIDMKLDTWVSLCRIERVIFRSLIRKYGGCCFLPSSVAHCAFARMAPVELGGGNYWQESQSRTKKIPIPCSQTQMEALVCLQSTISTLYSTVIQTCTKSLCVLPLKWLIIEVIYNTHLKRQGIADHFSRWSFSNAAFQSWSRKDEHRYS